MCSGAVILGPHCNSVPSIFISCNLVAHPAFSVLLSSTAHAVLFQEMWYDVNSCSSLFLIISCFCVLLIVVLLSLYMFTRVKVRQSRPFLICSCGFVVRTTDLTSKALVYGTSITLVDEWQVTSEYKTEPTSSWSAHFQAHTFTLPTS